MSNLDEILVKDKDSIDLEKWYVYRSLHSDESWGAMLIDAREVLPNCDFVMKVYATNEKEAIGRGRDLYEKVHKNDGKKDNIKRLTASTISTVLAKVYENSDGPVLNDNTIHDVAVLAVKLAVKADEEYEKAVKNLDDVPR